MTHATYFVAVAPYTRILRINQGIVWPNLVPVVVAVCKEIGKNSSCKMNPISSSLASSPQFQMMDMFQNQIKSFD